MPKLKLLGAVTAGTLALTALFAGPAGAASPLAVQVAAHSHACLSYSQRTGKCRAYAYRDVRPREETIIVPDAAYHRYHFEPPEGTNGPYLGFEPYNGYESSLGFSF